MRQVHWWCLAVLALAVLLPGVAAAQATGTITFVATGSGGDRDPGTPGLQVDEGDSITVTGTFHGKTGGRVRVRVGATGTAVYRSFPVPADYDITPPGTIQTGAFLNLNHEGAGSTPATLVYQVRDDAVVEGDETLILMFGDFFTPVILGTDPTGATAWTVNNPTSITITIRANDGSQAYLGGADGTVNEGTTLNVPVGVRGQSRNSSSGVGFAITGTATSADYEVVTQASPGGNRITFDPDAATGLIELFASQTSRGIPIRFINDADANGETLIVTLTSHTGGSGPAHIFSTAPRTYTIVEVDTAPDFGAQTVDAQTYTADTAITLTLPEATGGNGGLTYALNPDVATAVPGLRFNASTLVLAGTPTMVVGAVTLTYTVSDADTNADATDTDTLTFSVTVQAAADTAPAFATGVAPPGQTYTVGSAITLTLPEAAGGNGGLTYALNPDVATAVPGLVFDANTRIVSGTPTTIAGAVMLTYTAGDADDNVAAGDTDTLTFSVTVQAAVNPAVMISPTELTVAEGRTAPYSVVLTTDPGGTVTITPGIAQAGHDLTLTPGGALTFTASTWNQPQTVTVAAGMDSDTTNETVTITHSVSGYTGVTTAPSVTVNADERPAVEFQFLGVTTDEQFMPSDRNVFCLEVVSGPPAGRFNAVTLQVTFSGTATEGEDYTRLTPVTVTISSPNDRPCQRLTLINDNIDEDDETVVATIDVAGTTTADDVTFPLGRTNTFTIRDDDTAGITLSATALTVDEGRNASYTMVLATDPGGPVTITPSIAPVGDLSLTPGGALTFTSANWNSVQTVTVAAGEDSDAFDDSATISHMVDGYGSVTAVPVTVTVDDNDDPGAMIIPTNLTVAEGTTAPYSVVLTTDPGGTVTITPSIAQAGHDLTLTPGGALTFTASTWNQPQTVTVAAAMDSDTTNETVTITHSIAGYPGVTTAPSVTVNADEQLTFGMVQTALTVAESVGMASVCARTLSGPPDARFVASSLLMNINASTATEGADYTAPAFEDIEIMFDSHGQRCVDISIIDDNIDEDDEMFGISLTLSPITRARDSLILVDPDFTSITITDDDTDGITLSAATLIVDEGRNAIYTMVLATDPGGPVTITPSIAPVGDLSLTPGGALIFTAANWNSVQTVTVAAGEDSDNLNDTATITHAVNGYGSVTADPVSVTVTDNDTPGVTLSATALTVTEGATGAYTVVLDTEPAGEVTVTPTSGDTAVATVTGALIFTVANWNTAQTVTVTGVEDSNDVDDATTITHAVNGYGSVTAAPVPVTVTDNDGPGVTLSATALTVTEGATGAYTVVLDTEPAGEVTVTPTSGDTAAATVTGALTFTVANWNTAQTVTVTAAEDGDSVDDATTITHAVNGYGSVTAAPVAVTVTDNDTPGVTLSATALTVTEGTTGIYTVVLDTEPAGEVTVTPTSGDTAAATVTGALIFTVANWNTVQTVTVTATEDGDVVDAATTITHAVNGYGSVTAAPVAVTVTDNDTPGVTLSPTALTVPEGATGIYTVVLDSEPAGAVMVTPASGATAVATVTGALAFTVATWNTVQTVTVTGVADSDSIDEAATITHAVTGYGSVTTATPVTVTVPDTNSVPDFGTTSVTPRTYTVGEPIPTLTLPTASDGDAPLSYALTPMDDIPAGLTPSTDTRTLTGTPVATMTQVTRLTWTATDADNQQTFLTFTIVILANTDAKTRRDALNRVIMPEVARAIADQGVSAVARRIRQAGSDSVDAGQTLTLGGQSTLAGVLTTHGRALAEGAFNLKTLLGGSAFVLPLNASEVAPGTGLSALTLWGGGDYRVLSGKGDAINWDGDLFSARLGADARLRDDLLAGVAVSWSEADLDYTDTGSGDYEVGLTSVHPYIGWTALGGRLDLWATAGYGWGELEITTVDDDEDSQKSTSDVTMQTIGAGGSAQVLEGRAATLRIKGEALQTTTDVEGSESITAVRIGARRLRLGLEASRTHQLANGGQLVPTVEVGMRHDAGDGRTGTGAEVGGGMRYTDAANGLTVESHGRVLLGHSGDYQDWGIGGVVRLAAGRDGQGLSFSLQPTWGATASRAAQVWAQEAVAPASAVSRPRDGRVDMNLGYGLGWEEMLVTPYGNMTLTNGSARAYRLGSRMRLGGGMTLNLEGIRDETAARLVNHGIRLQVRGSDRTTFSLEGTRKETATQALNHGITLQLGLNF